MDESLNSGPAAAARRETERAFARWWSAHPALIGLRERLAALDAAGADDARALLEAARPLVEDLAWVRDAIAASVRAVAADPWFEPPLRPLDHARQLGLILYDDRRLRLSIQSVPLEGIAAHKAAAGAPRSVGFTGAITHYRVIRAAGTVLDLWEADPAGHDFAAARAGRCRRAGQMTLADGMRFAIDGTRQAWTIARQRGDLMLFQATAREPHAPLAIEYDAATGAFLSASATDGAIARLQIMASLLRRMGRRDAAPALAALAGEGPFFLRWHMARELAALSGKAAAPVLRRLAADDPHEEVRAAAARALELMAA